MTPAQLPPRDRWRLEHIAEACVQIATYTASGRESLGTELTYDAVRYRLTIVGEALNALSDETYARLGSVPPKVPKEMRNVIVHEYWRVDPDVVWTTVKRDIPALAHDVERLLAQ